MRLIQLHLHPFAGTVNKTYQFGNGLNVICGNNEAGKSTMLKSLLLVLLESTNLTKTEFKNLVANYIPLGGDSINIDLKFEVAGIDYELKKSWGANNNSSLNAIGQASINNPEKVQFELFKLLNLNKSTVRDVLFTTQAKIASTIDGINEDAEIGSSLDQILRSVILNTGGIVPEALKLQLEEEYNGLIQNWKLDEDTPVIKTNNKGSFENKWEKGLGEILKIAYELYDKQNESKARVQYDERLSDITNKIIEIQEKVNKDSSFTDSHRPLLESLTIRKEINLEIENIESRKKELQEVQASWNAINASLPIMKTKLLVDEKQLSQLKNELDNAGKSEGALVKVSHFKKVVELKSKLEEITKLKNEAKAIEDPSVASVKKINELLIKSQGNLDALEAAQKFSVEIYPKKNIEVKIQKGDGLVEKIKLIQLNPLSIEVNKGFVYESEEVTIHVKSLTDQIGKLSEQIRELKMQLTHELLKYDVKDYEVLKQLNINYNKVVQDYDLARSRFDFAIAGTSFENLEKEVNELQNLPKTREKEIVEELYDDLIRKITTDKIKIQELEGDKYQYVNKYISLDNLDELRLGLRQEESSAKLKLAALPILEAGIEIESFRAEYKEKFDRLKENETLLNVKELERASHEGAVPTVLASELQDQIDLLQRQKEQKVEEAKAIKKVLNKLDDILSRAPVNPYENYENKLSEYLTALSGGKYQVSTNGGVTPNVIKNALSNLELPTQLLSQGTSGVLGLSLRLAMADYFLADQNGFLAFDDPMVDFDGNRQEFAAICLQQYAQNKQVLIFTCHETHAEQLGGHLINLN